MYVHNNNSDMANFVKAGRPAKGAKTRVKRLDLRASEQEIALLDELVQVLHKRRNVGLSRMDLIAYLLEKEYAHQDSIRVISKTENPA